VNKTLTRVSNMCAHAYVYQKAACMYACTHAHR